MMTRLSNTFFSLLLITSTQPVHPSGTLFTPPDVSSISLTIQSPVCTGDKSAFLMLVLVLSHPGNFQRRMLIRKTYPAAEINALGIRRLFVLGSLQNEREPDPSYASISDAEIRAENDLFSDIIGLNLTENYHRLLFKCLAAFTWAAEHCKHALYIARTDDDVFIEYYSIQRKFSLTTRDNLGLDDKIIGFLLPRDELPPIRDVKHRNYISYEEYPFDKFPEWLTGALYVMTPKTMSRLVQTARTVPFFPLEDVYVTSLVAEAAGVRKFDFANLLALDVQSANCCVEREVVDGEVFACQFLAFEQLVTLTDSQARRIKEHGRFCFLFACRPHSAVALSAAPPVECF